MSIVKNLELIRSTLPTGVGLVCVSKFHPAAMIREAYVAGERMFGESRVQELCAKYEALQDLSDLQWHFIGHLQTNKVKYIVPFVHLIHGVDSPRLLHEINKEAVKAGREVNCLLQVHVAREETKFGFSPEELMEYMSEGVWRDYSGVRICGVMGMATNTDDEVQIKSDFAALRDVFTRLKEDYFPQDSSFCELSMGMSGDYPYALEYGATLVRIGSAIFGHRIY